MMKRFFLLFLLVILSGGCARFEPGQADDQEKRVEKFNMHMGNENSVQLSMQGYSSGYQPGGGADLLLEIRNGSSEPWEGQYCLQLVSHERIVKTFVNEQARLAPNDAQSRTVKLEIPAELAPGAYGLALVIPDRSTSITTIKVATEMGTMKGDWARPTCPPIQ